MRLFVAVTLPDALRDPLAALQSDLPDPLRRTDPADAHLTLKFLGETGQPDDARDALRAAVASVDVAPFTVRLCGLGVFPDRDCIRVVWVGVREGDEALSTLAAAVERETVAAGFDGRDHVFTPHVTLARADDARGAARVRDFVDETTPDVGSFRVEAVRLVESVLDGDGPRYQTVERAPLD
ncbi:MAG: 2''-5'' RNA ligase [uncultured archaeon A07HB70]|nr:MAG: 2''-5'' RNA ligase [uncultured archaeon A07HB70]